MTRHASQPSIKDVANPQHPATSPASIPFPTFIDTTSRAENRFVQFSYERDCAGALEFLRRIDPTAHANWWIREIFARTGAQEWGAQDKHPQDFFDSSRIEASITHPSLKERIMAALSIIPQEEHLVEAAGRFGYTKDWVSGKLIAPSLPNFEYASAAEIMQRQGESSERIHRIPELYDPEIFFEHPPTQSTFASRQRMKAEGEQDATCVRQYLTAYNQFMESPCVGHLLKATAFPKFGDSYTLTMKYCLNNKVSDDFIALLHVVFPIQWVIEGRPYSTTPAPEGSKGIFREDAQLLTAAIHHYCQGQRAAQQG